MRSLHKKPWWEPSKQHGYHAFSLGRLAEEAARRTEGRSRGRFWRKEMAKPPGTGCHIGLPAHDTRFATFIPIQGKSRLFFVCAQIPVRAAVGPTARTEFPRQPLPSLPPWCGESDGRIARRPSRRSPCAAC